MIEMQGSAPAPKAAGFRRVPVSALKPGMVLRSAIYGDNRERMFKAGMMLTGEMIADMVSRDIASVLLSADDFEHEQPASEEQPQVFCSQCGQGGPLLCKRCVESPPTGLRSAPAGASWFYFERSRFITPKKHLYIFAGAVPEETTDSPDGKRNPLIVDVPVIPLDDQLRVLGEPFLMVSRDISTNGIGLLHTRRIRPPFLGMEIRISDDEPMQFIAQIVGCEPVGDFFEYVCRFADRIQCG